MEWEPTTIPPTEPTVQGQAPETTAIQAQPQAAPTAVQAPTPAQAPSPQLLGPEPTTPPAPFTVAELKRRLDKELSTDDTLLSEYLLAAFVQAQESDPYGCGRNLWPEPESGAPIVQTINFTGHRFVLPDAREITKVVVDGTEVSGYRTTERNGVLVAVALHEEQLRSSTSGPYAEENMLTREPKRPFRKAEVTGRFGIFPCPADLREAIYILAARMYYERAVQLADQVAIAEGAGVQVYYRQLPPRVKLAFASYVLPQGIAGL